MIMDSDNMSTVWTLQMILWENASEAYLFGDEFKEIASRRANE